MYTKCRLGQLKHEALFFLVSFFFFYYQSTVYFSFRLVFKERNNLISSTAELYTDIRARLLFKTRSTTIGVKSRQTKQWRAATALLNYNSHMQSDRKRAGLTL